MEVVTGARLARVAGIIVLVLSLACVSAAGTAKNQARHRAKKPQPQLPPLPSGPTGQPIQPLSLESMPPVVPQVTYDHGQLAIVAVNSTLGDVLRAVKKQTGAEIDVPDAKERVVAHLGPGPAQEVMADLLNGSRFNYILLGSPQNPALLTRVVLVTKSGNGSTPQPSAGADQMDAANQPAPVQEATDDADAQPADDNADDGDPAAVEAEQQQQQQPEPQPGVKTPQELLQEMQQRQLQMQQQQPPGQPPIPGPGLIQREQK